VIPCETRRSWEGRRGGAGSMGFEEGCEHAKERIRSRISTGTRREAREAVVGAEKDMIVSGWNDGRRLKGRGLGTSSQTASPASAWEILVVSSTPATH
jgi:hypothetical protein